MTERSRFLARLIGLFLLCLAAPMAANRQEILDAILGTIRSPELLFLYGMIALALGLSLVLTHNVWRGGAATVVVTVVGWLLLVRSVILLFLPTTSLEELFAAIRFADFFYEYLVVVVALGLFLTWSGFRRAELD